MITKRSLQQISSVWKEAKCKIESFTHLWFYCIRHVREFFYVCVCECMIFIFVCTILLVLYDVAAVFCIVVKLVIIIIIIFFITTLCKTDFVHPSHVDYWLKQLNLDTVIFDTYSICLFRRFFVSLFLLIDKKTHIEKRTISPLLSVEDSILYNF